MVLMEVKEVLGSPRTGVMDGEPPCGCWGLNLQELGVLLVSESSLQTLEGLSLEDSPQNLCLTLQQDFRVFSECAVVSQKDL